MSQKRNYDIFVAKIYDYALIDSFWGFPGFIDSPTSYTTLVQSLKYYDDLLGFPVTIPLYQTKTMYRALFGSLRKSWFA